MVTYSSIDEEETLVLTAFDQYGELVIPEFALGEYLSRSKIKKAIDRLYKKGLVTKTRPLTLTKTGKQKVIEISQSALSRNVIYDK